MKLIPQLNYKEFAEWERKIQGIHSKIENNNNLINELLKFKNPFHWFFNQPKT